MQRRLVAALRALSAFALVAPLVRGLSAAHVLPARKLHLYKGATPATVGVQGYQRYHANDSLIGQPVDCSRQQKICFRFNMLYDKKLGCVGLNHHNANFSSGHLVPALFKNYDCAGYVMAYDDRCYRKEVVRDVICGCAAEPTRHFLHGVECRCVPPAPIRVEQPQEDGKCHIPDLRFPDEDRSRFYQNPYERIQGFTSNQYSIIETDSIPHFNCTSQQLQCFAQGKVWVGRAETCFPLLERGPCPDEHVVALDVRAALDGHVETTCVHVRGGCSPRHVRMPFDGNCHNEEDMKLIIGGEVLRNQFGMPLSISKYYRSLTISPFQYRESKEELPQLCAVMVRSNPFFHIVYVNVGVNEYKFSKRYEVENTPPKPGEDE